MTIYKCSVCETVFDEAKEGVKWEQLADDWACIVCESGKSFWRATDEKSSTDTPGVEAATADSVVDAPEKVFDDFETYMTDIHTMAQTGESIIEPMRKKSRRFPGMKS